MKTVVLDIETDGLKPTVIWCIVTKELGEEPKVWTGKYKDFREYMKGANLVVTHNGLSFDIPVINRLLGYTIDPHKVIDTFVVSRLVNYTGYRTHALAELGERLGERKGSFEDWSHLSEEMVEYCIQDVVVTEKIYEHYKKYIWGGEWSKALRTEHDIVLVCNDMSHNGFLFDVDRAKELLCGVKERMCKIEAEFREQWPPKISEVNRLKYRMKKDGSLYTTTQAAMGKYPKVWLEGSDLVCGDYISFNPGSTKDRVEKLWEAGWKPVERTKTHAKFLREAKVGKRWGLTRLTPALYKEKKDHFSYYGWVVGETNLLTLPGTAPEGAKKLAEWLTLEGRRSSLTEWLECVCEDGRIRGKFWGLGAWTHRMSHSAPNQANIFSPFDKAPHNSVEEVKAEYDRSLRALWKTDKVLVGTDAEGIQLRILCHYTQSEEYREAILNGKKEDKTDIHNLNRRALGLSGITRDVAKTFIYAWLLGAGTKKVGAILGVSDQVAKRAMNTFLTNLPELKRLKKGRVSRDASRGYFVGLDGRKVLCNNEHLMLAGYLQNGEAVVTKMWILEWRRLAKEAGLWYRQVNFVHDEVQVEVETEEDGYKLIELQSQAIQTVGRDLGLFCPLSVEGKLGKNWADTH